MALLTVEEIQAFTGSALPSAQLTLLLAATEAAIVERHGPTAGPLTEVVTGGQSVLALKRPVAAITSISETVGDNAPVVLATNDYYFAIGSEWLRRSVYGTTASFIWRDLVTVVYTPVDDTADRKRVQLRLVELELNSLPGLSAQTIGEWTEQMANNSAQNYVLEREQILNSLSQSTGVGFA